MERKTTTVCSYLRCSNSYKKKKELRMYRFPKNLAEEWVKNCGNPDLNGLSPSKLYKNKRLCEEHFRKEDILPSGRLVMGSIPLPYRRNRNESSTSSCAGYREIIDVNFIANRFEPDEICVYGNKTMSESQEPSSPADSTSSVTFAEEPPSTRPWVDNVSPAKQPDQAKVIRVKQNLFSIPSSIQDTEVKLQQHWSTKSASVQRRRKQILKSKSGKHPFYKKNFKSKDSAVLCNMQFHKTRKSWTKDEQKFSTALYLKSPSTYKYLLRRIVLPPQSTVQSWLRNKQLFRPGFNRSILDQVKLKTSTMTAREKSVVLMFDEMPLKKGLEDTQKRDFICPETAKQAAVFMVRGLYYEWKLPIAYFITESGLTGEQTKELILECIDQLGKSGLKVKAVVCDQRYTNMSAYKKLNVTEDNPCFLNSYGEKVFALHNTSNLLKSLKNNLIMYDFSFNGKRISFSGIRELYNSETLSGTASEAHQLSSAHIQPNSFKKLSVPPAAEIFSQSTSDALKFAFATGEIQSPTVLDTADFIQEIDNLNNAMNGKTRKTQPPASCTLSKTDDQIKTILKDGLNTFKVLKVFSNSKYSNPPCFRGFRLTISAILNLFESEGCDNLLTSRLNQDPLENLFSSIRQRGGVNRNPTVRVFRRYIQISVQKEMMELPKSTSSDLIDIYAVLQTLPVVNEDEMDVEVTNIECENDVIEASSSESEVDSQPMETECPALQKNNTITVEGCSQVRGGRVTKDVLPSFLDKPILHPRVDCSRKMSSLLLGYTVTPESALTVPGYDGLVYVSAQPPLQDQSAPEAIRNAITRAAKIDNALFTEGALLEVNLPAGRMVYSPTGPMTDYHDVRSFGDSAKKGILRALKANFKNPLLVFNPDSRFPNCSLVTILGAMEALYVNIQYREDTPEKSPKVKNLGVWSPDHGKLAEAVKLASVLENGRIVARDIGDCDPERMSPPRTEEYVREVFPQDSGISIKVVSDINTLTKDYPLFAAVNRGASVIERHRGRIIYLHYEPTGPVTDTLLLVGKGVTYDTGGADIKAGGVMAGMSRDKCGAAAVAGFMKVVSQLKPANVKVVAAMSMVRNSVGENCYVSDEVIKARSGTRVRVSNTDAEGRMIMADVLCYMKELVEKKEASVNPHLMTIATLTGHAVLTVGDGYNIAIDNGPACKNREASKFHEVGEQIGDPVEVSTLRREDFIFHKGKSEGDDVHQSGSKPSTQTPRGHQSPAAFLIMASGLDKHGLDSEQPIKYTHWDIAGGSGMLPDPATGSPVLALAQRYLLNPKL